MQLPNFALERIRHLARGNRYDLIKIVNGNEGPRRVGHGNKSRYTGGRWKTIQRAEWHIEIGYDWLIQNYGVALSVYRMTNDEAAAYETFVKELREKDQLTNRIARHKETLRKWETRPREYSFDPEEDERLYA